MTFSTPATFRRSGSSSALRTMPKAFRCLRSVTSSSARMPARQQTFIRCVIDSSGGPGCTTSPTPPRNIHMSANMAFFQLGTIRRESLTFHAEYRNFEDASFVARYLFCFSSPRIAALPDAVYLYRRRVDGSSLIQSGFREPSNSTPSSGSVTWGSCKAARNGTASCPSGSSTWCSTTCSGISKPCADMSPPRRVWTNRPGRRSTVWSTRCSRTSTRRRSCGSMSAVSRWRSGSPDGR